MSKAVGFIMSPLSIIDKKLGKIGQSIGLIALGIGTGNPGFIQAGVGGLADALKKTKTDGGRQAVSTSLQIGEGPRMALFGEAATPGSLS